MPRPNQPRSIASEQALARRIAYEREARGMSYEGLASRMGRAGCAIQASAIYKIEKSDPPRRITVDELVAFAQVFGVPVEQLLLPPEVAASKELARLAVEWNNAREAALSASEAERHAWRALREYVQEHPDLGDAVEKVMREWVELYVETDDPAWREFRVANHMQRLTKSDDWRARAKSLFDEVVAADMEAHGGE